MRLGSVTLKPSILRALLKSDGFYNDPVVELADQDGAIALRSADRRAKCTIRHGAGDPYAGRNGFEAIVQLAS